MSDLWQIDIIQIKKGSFYDGYFEKTADYSLFSVLDGQGSLLVDGQEYPIAKGVHFILPSDVQAWEIKGELELIVSHP